MEALRARCKKCRRRQVKCDMTRPACLRCQKDDFACPGYTERLQIIPYRPPQDHGSEGSVSKPCRSTSPAKMLARTAAFRTPNTDTDLLSLLEAVRGYDQCVAPFIRPSRYPFRQIMIGDSTPWHVLPKLMQRLFVVLLRSLQTARNGLDPMSQPDYCRYRGLCLSDVRSRITQDPADVHGIALVSVLMLMMADASLPSPDPWLSHFNAATRIMESLGGFEKSLHNVPSARVLLLNYMVVDILTSSTCESTSLNHQDYEILHPQLEAELLASHFPCPLVIYVAITRINNLRLFQSCQNQSSSILDRTVFEAEYDEIQMLLRSFNAHTWAISVQQYPQGPPPAHIDNSDPRDTCGLASLALCYQASCMLYLLYAFPLPRRNAVQQTTQCAMNSLQKHLGRLFRSPSMDGSALLDAQLWKFTSWAIFISVYIMICWDVQEIDDSPACIDEQMGWLQDLATFTRSRRLWETIAFLNGLRACGYPATRSTQVWDNGLSSSRLYLL